MYASLISSFATHKECHKPWSFLLQVYCNQWQISRVVLPIVLRTIGSPIYTLVFLKRSHRCLFLSTESWSRSEEGRGDQQMLPELLNKVFSTKSHNAYAENSIESLMTPGFRRKTRYVAVSVVTDTQNDYYNPRACAEGQLEWYTKNTSWFLQSAHHSWGFMVLWVNNGYCGT